MKIFCYRCNYVISSSYLLIGTFKVIPVFLCKERIINEFGIAISIKELEFTFDFYAINF